MVGLFRPKREEPVEPLSAEALLARVGLPPERPAKDVAAPQCLEPLRVDGPRPTEPRNWRAGLSGSR